jgi:hypothetical protein
MVAVMLQMLEAFAEGRARREMTALLGRVAVSGMRYGFAGLEEVSIESIRQGDRLLIRKGEGSRWTTRSFSTDWSIGCPKTLALAAKVLSGRC